MSNSKEEEDVEVEVELDCKEITTYCLELVPRPDGYGKV